MKNYKKMNLRKIYQFYIYLIIAPFFLLANETNGQTLITRYGTSSLDNNTNGDYNVGYGAYSLESNTTGSWNTSVGTSALRDNISGLRGTAVGTDSLYENTTGSYNTAVGAFSINQNTNGSYNTAIGEESLYWNNGSYNSAVGFATLYYNTTGTFNTADGAYSLFRNTTGGSNTASGYASLRSNTTGSYNTADGMYALQSNTTGARNTASGYYSLKNNKTGSYNTAFGSRAGESSLGSRNVFIGYAAGLNETGSDKLYISNSSTSSPLIKGDFAAGTLDINGDLTVTGDTTTTAVYHTNGTKMLSIVDGEVHLGPNSMVFTDSTMSATGDDIMSSSVGRVQIGRNSSDTTNVVGDLLVNGTSVMGSIKGLAEGVKATTAMTSAFSAVPAFSGDTQFECGMGAGAYGGKAAVAASCGASVNESITMNIGVSHMLSGSESYLVGDLPSYAVRGGVSFKFGAALNKSSSARVSGVNDRAFNEMRLSEARREADGAKQVAQSALEKASSSEAKAVAAAQQLNELRQQVAELEEYKEKINLIFAAMQKNGASLIMAALNR
jgi:hypothetical protein